MNFIGEKNYIVTTMECYKAIQPDIRSGKLYNHVKKCCSEFTGHFGIMVPVPWSFKPEDEYENPTELTNDIAWDLKVVFPCKQGSRRRSMSELLFLMLRSGH